MFVPKAFLNHKRNEMNVTEKAYQQLLSLQKSGGLIHKYYFQEFGLKIGEKCFYYPDFLVIMPDGAIEFHEVKGYWTDDAKVKIRACADKFPFIFKAYSYEKKKWVELDFTCR